jgi:precorrin-4 C11-methyltransferase
MRTAIITITAAGDAVARIVQQETQGQSIDRADVGRLWSDFDAFVFIGAMGICVRTIAPYVADKHSDPAVVCIDSTGRHVISVLSGHVGGANDLSRHLAAALGVEPIITTQSDNQNLWALDMLAQRYGWNEPYGNMQKAIFAFVDRQPTALLLDIRDEGTDYLERTLPSHVTLVHNIKDITPDGFKLAIIVSPKSYETIKDVPTIQYVPRVLTLGLGLARQAGPVDEVRRNIDNDLRTNRYDPSAIRDIATVDIKADEPVIKQLQQEGYSVRFFTADELCTIEVPTPSNIVASHVGTPSVCEAAAILATDKGQLLLPKEKGTNYTIALAIDRRHLRGTSPKSTLCCYIAAPHIEIVGAGPGDPDLISVRGRRFLEQADLILYAGSLVPRELTECHKPGAVVRSSASMALEEQCALMKEFYDQGKLIVRLHTGDPCIFGAIQEQMAFFDEHQMSYHITPGISSFLAAAAELRSQFTIPERTQTIILTRGEGRTPMPDKEKLHLLARSQSTMCIFLSAAIVDDVQRELLQEYPENTPVAACYHLTWADQRIYRGQLKDLARIVHDNNLTLTTMLVVGESIDNRHGLSELYNRNFTHLFRKGTT